MSAQRQHFPSPFAATAIAVGAWLLSAAIILAIRDPDESKIGISVLGVGQALGLGIVATLAGRAIPPPQSDRLGIRGFGSRAAFAILLLLPISLVVSELVNVAQSLFPAPDAGEVAERTLERLSLQSALATLETVIVVVGIAPVVEEWLYRGVIQQGLIAHVGRWRGILLTSVLFGAAHVEPTGSAAGGFATILATLPLGLVLGALRLASGSLLAAIALHAAYNGLALLALGFSAEIPIPGYNAPGEHSPPGLILSALVVVGLGTALLWQDLRDAPVALPIPEPDPSDEDDEPGGFFP